MNHKYADTPIRRYDCSSPYSGEMISLKFGPTSRNYQVPIGLIKDFSWAPERVKNSRKPWFGYGSISMSDIAENIGHVLIHYLYTGTYQILLQEKENLADYCIYNLETALEVLFAAQKCEMAGLQELAKSMIQGIAKSKNILCIVQSVDFILQKKENNTTTESRVWLYEFISSRIRVEYENYFSFFDCVTLLNILHDKNLLKYMAKNMFEIINSRMYLSDNMRCETDSSACSPFIMTPTSPQSENEW
ncbi:hypothetical protein Golomagni_02023 [Golovinomyces magnicellulatus]|nr:hypothetical protein Golomagni_02023 [Golovinomyces magnicellulatus]